MKENPANNNKNVYSRLWFTIKESFFEEAGDNSGCSLNLLNVSLEVKAMNIIPDPT